MRAAQQGARQANTCVLDYCPPVKSSDNRSCVASSRVSFFSYPLPRCRRWKLVILTSRLVPDIDLVLLLFGIPAMPICATFLSANIPYRFPRTMNVFLSGSCPPYHGSSCDYVWSQYQILSYFIDGCSHQSSKCSQIQSSLDVSSAVSVRFVPYESLLISSEV